MVNYKKKTVNLLKWSSLSHKFPLLNGQGGLGSPKNDAEVKIIPFYCDAMNLCYQRKQPNITKLVVNANNLR